MGDNRRIDMLRALALSSMRPKRREPGQEQSSSSFTKGERTPALCVLHTAQLDDKEEGELSSDDEVEGSATPFAAVGPSLSLALNHTVLSTHTPPRGRSKEEGLTPATSLNGSDFHDGVLVASSTLPACHVSIINKSQLLSAFTAQAPSLISSQTPVQNFLGYNAVEKELKQNQSQYSSGSAGIINSTRTAHHGALWNSVEAGQATVSQTENGTKSESTTRASTVSRLFPVQGLNPTFSQVHCAIPSTVVVTVTRDPPPVFSLVTACCESEAVTALGPMLAVGNITGRDIPPVTSSNSEIAPGILRGSEVPTPVLSSSTGSLPGGVGVRREAEAFLASLRIPLGNSSRASGDDKEDAFVIKFDEDSDSDGDRQVRNPVSRCPPSLTDRGGTMSSTGPLSTTALVQTASGIPNQSPSDLKVEIDRMKKQIAAMERSKGKSSTSLFLGKSNKVLSTDTTRISGSTPVSNPTGYKKDGKHRVMVGGNGDQNATEEASQFLAHGHGGLGTLRAAPVDLESLRLQIAAKENELQQRRQRLAVKGPEVSRVVNDLKGGAGGGLVSSVTSTVKTSQQSHGIVNPAGNSTGKMAAEKSLSGSKKEVQCKVDGIPGLGIGVLTGNTMAGYKKDAKQRPPAACYGDQTMIDDVTQPLASHNGINGSNTIERQSVGKGTKRPHAGVDDPESLKVPRAYAGVSGQNNGAIVVSLGEASLPTNLELGGRRSNVDGLPQTSSQLKRKVDASETPAANSLARVDPVKKLKTNPKTLPVDSAPEASHDKFMMHSKQSALAKSQQEHGTILPACSVVQVSLSGERMEAVPLQKDPVGLVTSISDIVRSDANEGKDVSRSSQPSVRLEISRVLSPIGNTSISDCTESVTVTEQQPQNHATNLETQVPIQGFRLRNAMSAVPFTSALLHSQIVSEYEVGNSIGPRISSIRDWQLDSACFSLETLQMEEELLDKELEEAQKERHQCELRERLARKEYRDAQRALRAVYTQCDLLNERKELLFSRIHIAESRHYSAKSNIEQPSLQLKRPTLISHPHTTEKLDPSLNPDILPKNQTFKTPGASAASVDRVLFIQETQGVGQKAWEQMETLDDSHRSVKGGTSNEVTDNEPSHHMEVAPFVEEAQDSHLPLSVGTTHKGGMIVQAPLKPGKPGTSQEMRLQPVDGTNYILAPSSGLQECSTSSPENKTYSSASEGQHAMFGGSSIGAGANKAQDKTVGEEGAHLLQRSMYSSSRDRLAEQFTKSSQNDCVESDGPCLGVPPPTTCEYHAWNIHMGRGVTNVQNDELVLQSDVVSTVEGVAKQFEEPFQLGSVSENVRTLSPARCANYVNTSDHDRNLPAHVDVKQSTREKLEHECLENICVFSRNQKGQGGSSLNCTTTNMSAHENLDGAAEAIKQNPLSLNLELEPVPQTAFELGTPKDNPKVTCESSDLTQGNDKTSVLACLKYNEVGASQSCSKDDGIEQSMQQVSLSYMSQERDHEHLPGEVSLAVEDGIIFGEDRIPAIDAEVAKTFGGENASLDMEMTCVVSVAGMLVNGVEKANEVTNSKLSREGFDTDCVPTGQNGVQLVLPLITNDAQTRFERHGSSPTLSTSGSSDLRSSELGRGSCAESEELTLYTPHTQPEELKELSGSNIFHQRGIMRRSPGASGSADDVCTIVLKAEKKQDKVESPKQAVEVRCLDFAELSSGTRVEVCGRMLGSDPKVLTGLGRVLSTAEHHVSIAPEPKESSSRMEPRLEYPAHTQSEVTDGGDCVSTLLKERSCMLPTCVEEDRISAAMADTPGPKVVLASLQEEPPIAHGQSQTSSIDMSLDGAAAEHVSCVSIGLDAEQDDGPKVGEQDSYPIEDVHMLIEDKDQSWQGDLVCEGVVEGESVLQQQGKLKGDLSELVQLKDVASERGLEKKGEGAEVEAVVNGSVLERLPSGTGVVHKNISLTQEVLPQVQQHQLGQLLVLGMDKARVSDESLNRNVVILEEVQSSKAVNNPLLVTNTNALFDSVETQNLEPVMGHMKQAQSSSREEILFSTSASQEQMGMSHLAWVPSAVPLVSVRCVPRIFNLGSDFNPTHTKDLRNREKEPQRAMGVPIAPSRYESPLGVFRSYRLHPHFSDAMYLSHESSTWNHAINPHKPLCKFEHRGKCNNEDCPWQHVGDYTLSSPRVFSQVRNEDPPNVLSLTEKLSCDAITCLNGDLDPGKSSVSTAVAGSIGKTQVVASASSTPKIANFHGFSPLIFHDYELSVPTYRIGSYTLKADNPTTPSPSVHCLQYAGKADTFHSFLLCPSIHRPLPSDLPCLLDISNSRPSFTNVGSHGMELPYWRYRGAVQEEQDLAESSLLQGSIDEETWLELALNQIDYDIFTDSPKARDEALCVLSRALESRPSSVTLWVAYSCLFHTRKDNPENDDMFHFAVQYNQGSYELWMLYINSRTDVLSRTEAYEKAIVALADEGTQLEIPQEDLSAYLLDTVLRMLYSMCVSGCTQDALSWVDDLLHDASVVDEAKSHRGSTSAILTHLTPHDACILWISCTYLSACSELPTTIVRQLGCKQHLPYNLEWEKHASSGMVARTRVMKALNTAASSARGCLSLECSQVAVNNRIDLSRPVLGVNYLQCLALYEGLDIAACMGQRLINLYPNSVELILIHARIEQRRAGVSAGLHVFEEAVAQWPVEQSGIQRLWNQYMGHALLWADKDWLSKLLADCIGTTNLYSMVDHQDSTSRLQPQAYISMSNIDVHAGDNLEASSLEMRSRLRSFFLTLTTTSRKVSGSFHDQSTDGEDSVFAAINVALIEALRGDQKAAHSAINKAMKIARSEKELRHCWRELAGLQYAISATATVSQNTGVKERMVNLLDRLKTESYIFSQLKPLSEKVLKNLKGPRVRNFFVDVLGPPSFDHSLLNSILETCFGPSLLPSDSYTLKEAYHFAEGILEAMPGNVEVAFSLCKTVFQQFQQNGALESTYSMAVWASALLISALRQSCPVAPEVYWVEAGLFLKQLGQEGSLEEYYIDALIKYPFSAALQHGRVDAHSRFQKSESATEAANRTYPVLMVTHSVDSGSEG